MKFYIFSLLLLNFLSCYSQKKFTYPILKKDKTIDTIWNYPVADPYRWMENLDSPELKPWLEAQEKLKNRFAGTTYNPLLTYLPYYSDVDFKPLIKEGKYFFSFKYEKSYQTPSLYYQTNEEKEEKYLFNPNFLDKKNNINLNGISASPNSRYLALLLSINGGDWNFMRIMDMNTKKLISDTISGIKYGNIGWYKNGIFYIKYNVKDLSESFKGTIKGRALYYHKLGTPQSSDTLIYKLPNEYKFFDFTVTDEQYLIVSKTENGKRIITCNNITNGVSNSFQNFIVSNNSKINYFIKGVVNDQIIVFTNFNAPNGRVMLFDPNSMNKGKVLIPEIKDYLETVDLINNKLVCTYKNDERDVVAIYNLEGELLTYWAIPEGFSIAQLTGSPHDSIAVYRFNSFYCPSSIYKINMNTYERTPLSKTYINFDHNKYTTRKVWYKSKDSTMIPMYLTYKKNIKLDGSNPCLLYGYGGFGISMEPFYNVANIIFLMNNGILATPCIRGGGEFPGWHDAGIRHNKQNSFDDFIAAAEYLINNNYTNSERIASMGGSNGGLLVCATMLQRPNLFKAVISTAGVLDMLRYDLYNIGYVHTSEYGSCKDSLDFEYLIKYSPVQNVRKGIKYPATLLVASNNDDRVNPFHSFKFLAELQEKGSDESPYILYYQEKAGHSGSMVYRAEIEKKALIYSFIFKTLKMEGKMQYSD